MQYIQNTLVHWLSFSEPLTLFINIGRT